MFLTIAKVPDNWCMTLFQNKYRVKSARLKGWDYRSPGWYFVTICTRDHTCIFGDIADGRIQLLPAGEVADSELRSLPGHYLNTSIDCFIVMPNHMHAIVVIDGQHRHSLNPETRSDPPVPKGLTVIPPKAGSLAAIVRSYEAGVTRRCHAMGLKTFACQGGYYDHIMRGKHCPPSHQRLHRTKSSQLAPRPRKRTVETLLAMFR